MALPTRTAVRRIVAIALAMLLLFLIVPLVVVLALALGATAALLSLAAALSPMLLLGALAWWIIKRSGLTSPGGNPGVAHS